MKSLGQFPQRSSQQYHSQTQRLPSPTNSTSIHLSQQSHISSKTLRSEYSPSAAATAKNLSNSSFTHLSSNQKLSFLSAKRHSVEASFLKKTRNSKENVQQHSTPMMKVQGGVCKISVGNRHTDYQSSRILQPTSQSSLQFNSCSTAVPPKEKETKVRGGTSSPQSRLSNSQNKTTNQPVNAIAIIAQKSPSLLKSSLHRSDPVVSFDLNSLLTNPQQQCRPSSSSSTSLKQHGILKTTNYTSGSSTSYQSLLLSNNATSQRLSTEGLSNASLLTDTVTQMQTHTTTQEGQLQETPTLKGGLNHCASLSSILNEVGLDPTDFTPCQQQVNENLQILLTRLDSVNSESGTCIDKLLIKQTEISSFLESEKSKINAIFERCLDHIQDTRVKVISRIESMMAEQLNMLNTTTALLNQQQEDMCKIRLDIEENVLNIFTNLELKPFQAIFHKYCNKLDTFESNISQAIVSPIQKLGLPANVLQKFTNAVDDILQLQVTSTQFKQSLLFQQSAVDFAILNPSFGGSDSHIESAQATENLMAFAPERQARNNQVYVSFNKNIFDNARNSLSSTDSACQMQSSIGDDEAKIKGDLGLDGKIEEKECDSEFSRRVSLSKNSCTAAAIPSDKPRGKSPNSFKYLDLIDKINTNQLNTNMFYSSLISSNSSSSNTNNDKNTPVGLQQLSSQPLSLQIGKCVRSSVTVNVPEQPKLSHATLSSPDSITKSNSISTVMKQNTCTNVPSTHKPLLLNHDSWGSSSATARYFSTQNHPKKLF